VFDIVTLRHGGSDGYGGEDCASYSREQMA